MSEQNASKPITKYLRAKQKARQKRDRDFEQLTKACNTWVQEEFGVISYCHDACEWLVEKLHDHGYENAQQIGCSVVTRDIQRKHFETCGEWTEMTDDPAHSIVLVCGFLLDPTVRQFRKEYGILLPNYLILPPEEALPHLRYHRRVLRIEDPEGEMLDFHKTDDYWIAYVPSSRDGLLNMN